MYMYVVTLRWSGIPIWFLTFLLSGCVGIHWKVHSMMSSHIMSRGLRVKVESLTVHAVLEQTQDGKRLETIIIPPNS